MQMFRTLSHPPKQILNDNTDFKYLFPIRQTTGTFIVNSSEPWQHREWSHCATFTYVTSVPKDLDFHVESWSIGSTGIKKWPKYSGLNEKVMFLIQDSGEGDSPKLGSSAILNLQTPRFFE